METHKMERLSAGVVAARCHNSARNCPTCGKFAPSTPWYYGSLMGPALFMVALLTFLILVATGYYRH